MKFETKHHYILHKTTSPEQLLIADFDPAAGATF